jgi:type I restriction enzyme R subunit
LIRELEEALSNTEVFLSNEVNFDIYEIINAENKLVKLAAIGNGIEAVYTNDETKRKFQIYAREVFKKFKAIMPDKD